MASLVKGDSFYDFDVFVRAQQRRFRNTKTPVECLKHVSVKLVLGNVIPHVRQHHSWDYSEKRVNCICAQEFHLSCIGSHADFFLHLLECAGVRKKMLTDIRKQAKPFLQTVVPCGRDEAIDVVQPEEPRLANVYARVAEMVQESINDEQSRNSRFMDNYAGGFETSSVEMPSKGSCRRPHFLYHDTVDGNQLSPAQIAAERCASRNYCSTDCKSSMNDARCISQRQLQEYVPLPSRFGSLKTVFDVPSWLANAKSILYKGELLDTSWGLTSIMVHVAKLLKLIDFVKLEDPKFSGRKSMTVVDAEVENSDNELEDVEGVSPKNMKMNSGQRVPKTKKKKSHLCLEDSAEAAAKRPLNVRVFHVFMFAPGLCHVRRYIYTHDYEIWMMPNTTLCRNRAKALDDITNVHIHMILVFRNSEAIDLFRAATTRRAIEKANGGLFVCDELHLDWKCNRKLARKSDDLMNRIRNASNKRLTTKIHYMVEIKTALHFINTVFYVSTNDYNRRETIVQKFRDFIESSSASVDEFISEIYNEELSCALADFCASFHSLNGELTVQLRNLISNSESSGKNFRQCVQKGLARVAKAIKNEIEDSEQVSGEKNDVVFDGEEHDSNSEHFCISHNVCSDFRSACAWITGDQLPARLRYKKMYSNLRNKCINGSRLFTSVRSKRVVGVPLVVIQKEMFFNAEPHMLTWKKHVSIDEQLLWYKAWSQTGLIPREVLSGAEKFDTINGMLGFMIELPFFLQQMRSAMEDVDELLTECRGSSNYESNGNFRRLDLIENFLRRQYFSFNFNPNFNVLLRQLDV